MNIFVPDNLAAQAREKGEEGTRWLDSLPGRITELERRAGFRTGPAFNHGGCVSWVAPVELDAGGEAVLKIGMPHEEARYEADALRFLDGNGTVHLLHASDDGFSLLLERCLPGTDLWSLGETERDGIACALLPRLWREPNPVRRSSPWPIWSPGGARRYRGARTPRGMTRDGRRSPRTGERTGRQPAAARLPSRRLTPRQRPGGGAGTLAGD